MWPQLGIGQSYNPWEHFGIRDLDYSLSSMPATGMPAAIGPDAWSAGMYNTGSKPFGLALTDRLGGGLHGPQLSDWGGGMGGLGQIMAASGVLNDIFTQRDPNQGWLGAGLQGALQGAGAGSMFGPVGAAIGAPVGYVAGKK